MMSNAEKARLISDAKREANWKRWGPYLSERPWATVREDYSPGGGCWDYFPHDHARSRSYRRGADGLLGIADRQCKTSASSAYKFMARRSPSTLCEQAEPEERISPRSSI
jgi:hypothetical protein